MTYADTNILVERALAEGYGLRVELDAGVFDLFGADLREEWDVLMPGEPFDVLGTVTEGIDDSIERDEKMTTTAERIAELTAAWEEGANYGELPEYHVRASDYALSEDDWRAYLSDDEVAEIVALIERQAENQERAERIAARVWKDHMLDGGSIQDMLTAAALEALSETENPR